MASRGSKFSDDRANPQDQPSGTRQSRLLGAIDEPSPALQVAAGPTRVRGWAAHRRRVVSGVVITVNGRPVGGSEVAGPRPDVAAAHPDLPTAARSGWSAEIDLRSLAHDDARIDVFAVLEPRTTAGGGAEELALGQVVHLSSVTVPAAGAHAGEVRGGCFVSQEHFTSGYQKIYGLAEAPAGVSKVEVFCDGVSAGRARTALPGRFEGADQGPESKVALFERVVQVPVGRPRVTLTAVVTPCVGDPFEIRPWVAEVEEADVDDWSPERIELVRRRTDEALQASRASGPVRSGQGGGPRVLVATHDLGLGGGQLYLQELLKRLADKGVSCCVVSPRGGRLLQELEDLEIPVLVTGTFDPHDPESYEAQVRQIALWAVEHSCDVALANTMSAFSGVDAAQRLGLDVVWAIHESFPVPQFWSEAFPPPRPTYIEERSRAALLATRHAVFEASATLDLYAPWMAVGAGEMVPYGVDFSEIDAYRARVDRDQLRADLGFGENTLVLLCLGTIEPRKAQINIAQALAGSEALGGRDVCLVLVGAKKGSPYVEALEELVEDYAETRVRVEPVQPDTYQWYHASDVLISGSDVESLPRSMLEAMAFDRPIASTDVFGIPELITDGVDGFLCESRDLMALRRMLERVGETPREQLVEMGRRARTRVLERHDPEIYATYFHELLHSLASQAAVR